MTFSRRYTSRAMTLTIDGDDLECNVGAAVMVEWIDGTCHAWVDDTPVVILDDHATPVYELEVTEGEIKRVVDCLCDAAIEDEQDGTE